MLYFKGTRIMMLQLSGFYCKCCYYEYARGSEFRMLDFCLISGVVRGLLGGSWDLVSRVISTLIGAVSPMTV